MDPGEGAAGGQLVVEGHQVVGRKTSRAGRRGEVVRVQGPVVVHGWWYVERGARQGGGGRRGVLGVPVTGGTGRLAVGQVTGALGGVALHGKMGRCPPTLDEEHEPIGKKQKP